ncbi:alpha-glucosidase/alpha-galactosidase [Paenibacillus sacheonensis]|uniref:Alpha-galactosidase n=1 Tax=Paenibacillus sacheonensis TaxID=742054 RepID=A0A7X4YJG3_9BACL|nr:alpha-glucosidase/alpha-galactosidase [Paenibacillus sacheonensis]MBM7564227.1 alpha-galactosidase [Paenibacillus sacheonensis]NBC67450.1 alpha-galactosidase [Paenibacillus sacheonensis]
MAFKVTIVGAGSIGFTRWIMRDLLSVPEFRAIEVAFTDISEGNLAMVAELCQRDIEANGLPVRIQSTTDRREALRGAKYVFCTFRVGGLDAFETDIEIPLKYGIDQCVGDTLSAGGIMYGQRGIAEMMSLCRDIRETAAKDVLLLNHANPLAMLTWACNKYGGVNTVGLCHGVQGGHHQIASALGLKQEEVDIICAGINHQTWYVQVRYQGEDMTGKLLEAFENDPYMREFEKVRIDMLRRFGYYSTESNGHLSEYVPWYRKRPDEIMDWIDIRGWIAGETGGYLRICMEEREWFKADFPNWLKAPAVVYGPDERGVEHGSYIVEALETGRLYRGHFNVVNNGIISNLPSDAIVEAPGYADASGIHMPVVGELPLGPAAVCQASISVQRLAVEAAIHGDDLLLRQAFMMDPLVGAVCNPPEIWQLVDEMLIAGEKWLPQYGEAIAKAKTRQAAGGLLPTREGYRGAARLRTRTLEELKAERESWAKHLSAADQVQLEH